MALNELVLGESEAATGTIHAARLTAFAGVGKAICHPRTFVDVLRADGDWWWLDKAPHLVNCERCVNRLRKLDNNNRIG